MTHYPADHGKTHPHGPAPHDPRREKPGAQPPHDPPGKPYPGDDDSLADAPPDWSVPPKM